MNLWVKNLGLILGLALLFFSCEDPEEVGLELNPDAGKFKSAFTEVPVRVGQIQAEPYLVADSVLQADIRENTPPRISKLLIGKISDDKFGTTTATTYTQLNMLVDSLDIDDGASLVGIELQLYINDIYDQTPTFGSEQVFYIYQLNEEIDRITSLNDQYEFGSQPFAQFSVNSDSAIMDTTILVTLPDTLGQRFIESVRDSTSNNHFLNNEEFTKFFKGIAIVPDENNTMMMELSPGSQSTYLRLGYNDSKGGDSLFFNMANANRSLYINSDRTGTPINNIAGINDPDYNLDKLYLKSGVGLMGYINLEDIRNIRDSAQGFIVNKAELLIEETLDNDTLKSVPPGLSIYIPRENFQFNYLSMPWRQSSFYNYVFNQTDTTRSINNYIVPGEVNLAVYLNETIKTGTDPGLYIVPSPYATSVQQAIIDKESFKLRLYFSYLK